MNEEGKKRMIKEFRAGNRITKPVVIGKSLQQ